MAYSFQRKSLPADELHRILWEQLTSALVAGEELPVAEASHQIRKHCKKIRALMRLVRNMNVHSERLYQFENAHFRSIAEALSGSRDAVSLYDALTKQLGKEHFPATAALLSSRIDTADAETALQQATDLLRQAQQHSDNWSLPSLNRKALKKGYARSYQRAFRAMESAFEQEDEESFHTLRKRVKDQWYHTRLLHRLKPQKIGHRREPLKILASALGDWRDLRMLCAFLANQKQAVDLETQKEMIPLLDAAQQRLAELRSVINRQCDLLFHHRHWPRQCKNRHAIAK
ncbi:CHAD domain-containing protein [Microbulbifer sp. CAU 1566]|uniref:CHAD domain-containing protein n=1 Tax=Microbulbifer sp. CAU 1566 TaxID=2933269 RepID=UPI002002B613|nr:CHAD domain-containing protein [Microbulbifer sp. CAU 1566]MCK7597905.1 CHAD domain-containing protein [Microbulbifer sp. CAU 1566]